MIHLIAAHWQLLTLPAVFGLAALAIAWGEARDTIRTAQVQQRLGRRK